MTARIQLRNYQILVNSLDVTNCVRADGSFCEVGEDLVDNSGYLRTTGSLILMPVLGFSESLDPRRNTRFTRGAKVEIKVAKLGSNTCQPFRTLRVLQDPAPPYPGREYITLQLGDVLDLLDFDRPNGIENEFQVGATKSRTDLINQLLTSIGGPQLIDQITSWPLEYPVYRDNGSVVAQCAQIAYESGFALWVDPSENVRAIPLNQGDLPLRWDPFVVGTDETVHEPIDARQPPFEKLKVFGVATPVDDGQTTITYTDEQQGYITYWEDGTLRTINGIRRRITITDTINWNTNTRSTEELVEEPIGLIAFDAYRGGLPGRTLVTKYRKQTDCSYDSDGFLISRNTTIKKIGAEIAKAQPWGSIDIDGRPIATYIEPFANWASPYEITETTSDTQTETFTIDSKQRIQSYYSLKRSSRWSVIGDYDIALTVGTLPPNPTLGILRLELIDAEEINDTWSENRQNEWTFSHMVKRPYLEVLSRQQVDPSLEIPDLPPLGQRGTMVIDGSESSVKISGKGDTQPAQAERIPSPQEVSQDPIEVLLEFTPLNNSQYRKVEEQLEIQTAVDEDQLRYVGNIYASWILGSQSPFEVKTYLPDFLLDNPYPLFRVRIRESSSFTLEATIHGQSLTLMGDSCLLGFQTCYRGEVSGDGFIPPYNGIGSAIFEMEFDFDAVYNESWYRRTVSGDLRVLVGGNPRVVVSDQ